MCHHDGRWRQKSLRKCVEVEHCRTFPQLEVLGGPVEGHGLDSLGCLPRVLEVNSQVGALGLSTLGGIVRLNCVTTHGSV